jgi:hypothetical protein
MTELVRTPPSFEEAGMIPKQYGLAWLLEPKGNYAEQPFDEAYGGLDSLLPFFESLSPEELADFDITVFYSRMRTDLIEEQAADLETSDLFAYAAAINTEKLLAYGRGKTLENEDTHTGPYDGMNFKPNCMSFCFWPSRRDARGSARSRDHEDPAGRWGEWYEKACIVKLKPELVTDEQSGMNSLRFRVEHVLMLPDPAAATN